MSRPDLYFSLIHDRGSFPDEWVERFHRRLEEEVRSRATPSPGLRAGSLYFSTRREAQVAPVATRQNARVLVPLYTREFLHSPPPDFAPFLNRPSDSADLPFVHPVMWDVYVPPREVCGMAQALSLGHGVREYQACGMATICRHNAYAGELRQLVELLADRIVRAAEHPGRLPDWMLLEAPPIAAPEPEARFLIIVARPAGAGREWTPFGPDRSSAIERAVQAAHQLRLLPEIVDALNGPPGGEDVRDFAGILLLDPETLLDATTRTAVEELLRDLPRWTTVVVVSGHEPRLREPAARAVRLTGGAAREARSAPDFSRAADEAIRRARRYFLRGHPS
ncbi:hypothetical protein AB0J83_40305 [Actinoplanes sp. NPDC049596]|uniref:hypothetical protein n=1 Tax=unclassified Actinoplanes TaxID=2626549 RepID=UPI0034363BA0